MNISDLNISIRDINAISRSGCTTVEELRQKISDDMDGMKRQLGFATFEHIEDALAEISGVKEQAPAVIVSEDYTKAITLTRSIIANAQAAQQSLYEVCTGLKEMRDGKLYTELGYQNFEDYAENEVGFSRMHAYRYLKIAENLTEDFVTSMLQIGTTKLALLAKLDEPVREAVTETVDVESVTVKELKAQITALTAERDENEHAAALLSEELDSAKESLASKDKQFKEAMESKDKQLQSTHKQWVDSQNKVAKLTSKNCDLEEQLKNLESRPVEVAVSEEEAKEIERLKKELEDEQLRAETIKKQADALKDEQEKKRLDLMKRHDQELKKLREGYEKQIADAGIDDESKRKIEDEAYIKAITQQFEDLVDLLEEWIEDLPPDDVLRHMKCIDEYYRKNLRYLMYQKGVED